MPRNPKWEREELILALDLYMETGMLDDKHPKVTELSTLLNDLALTDSQTDSTRFRNPNGVAMKLANFAAIDPSHSGTALQGYSRLDKEVFDEFSGDRDRLAIEADAIRAKPRIGTIPKRSRQYWAFFADPKVYDIEAAIVGREVDNWTTKDKPIQAGDRVAFWKGKGRSQTRGIVSLGEVLTDPAMTDDSHNPFWKIPPTTNDTQNRVSIRYVRTPDLPLWIDGPHASLLGSLSVSRAMGGTVFRITSEQWETLMQAIGGWPSDTLDAQQAISELTSTRRTGQRFSVDPQMRRAIEQHAMDVAIAYYKAQDWEVDDVSRTSSYDLRCRRPSSPDLRVEVKGTTSTGDTVILTRNEVNHARKVYPNIALFIVSNIRVEVVQDAPPSATDGTITVFDPWKIDDGVLTSLSYEYAVPPDE